ncbi:MAG: helix-turn-helix transcriptional regulator [Gracilimonas sp.]|uniref:response regulator transcription factor n=1 Tax=Gracilimonas sp. TaxID=1974203 RepID=UPI0019A884D4|nr:helix-turn-helix transcriptional regulator [Gracilimonas sp.]MBD3616904.1 helix-turn-helix transcriptional regulator [Gracilimonas sp.]
MSYLTDKELLERFEFYTMQVEGQLLKGEDFNTIADQIPYSVHLNNSETLEVIQTNRGHAEVTGYHLDEIRELGMEYLENNVHPHTMASASELISSYARLNHHQTFTFVQYVKLHQSKDFSPLITVTKSSKLLGDLVVCLSPQPKDFGSMSPKMEQIVKMDQFKLKHFKRFQQLTEREVEILKLLANGCNNPDIAEQLFISRSTVETHRKNLKRKLNLKSFRDLMKYAFAFDLVGI